MTLKNIAKITETTVSTVSKAFRDSKEISEETKTKIFNAAKALGCFEKYYRGKRGGKIVGIICPEPESETYGIAVGAIERALHKKGVETLVGISRFDAKRARDIYSCMVYRARVDGIISLCGIEQINDIEYVPTVLVGESLKNNSIGINIVIRVDEAINELIAILKKEGYKRIGFIGESLTRSRLTAFKHAMRKNGLPLYEENIFIAQSSRFAEAGIEGMLSFIKSDATPEVIITAYDNIAFGAMKVARENGYSIPDDVSFIGINDITTSEYTSVSLSSIDTSYEDVAASAVDVLLEEIGGNGGKRLEHKFQIPAKFQFRQSTKISDTHRNN